MIDHLRHSLLLAWIAVGLWLALIFFLSSQSSLPGSDGAYHQIISVAVHIFLYAVLMGLTVHAWLVGGVSLKLALIRSFIFCVFYGVIDEIHQSFVPGREAHLSDWLLDLVGAYLAMSFYTYKSIYIDHKV